MLEAQVGPGVAADGHEAKTAIDHPCQVLHDETPPFGEIAPVFAEEWSLGTVEKRHRKAVGRDLAVGRLLIDVLVEMEEPVEIGGDGVEKTELNLLIPVRALILAGGRVVLVRVLLAAFL